MVKPTPQSSIWAGLKTEDPGGSDIKRWLHWHPAELDQCIAARGGRLPAPLGESERAELQTAHERWGAGPGSVEAIERLGGPATRVVVTGQQPGLLGGPLYALYKALGTIKLARELSGRYPDLSFVPVFWVASEDHDFDEVRRAYWTAPSGGLEQYLLHLNDQPGQMVGPYPMGPRVDGLIERIEETSFKTEFLEDVLKLVRAAYSADAGLEDGFCRILLRLVRDTGLVIISPLMDWVRRRAAAILEREFSDLGRSTERIIERGAEMRSGGVEPTLHRPPGTINSFWVDPDGRRFSLRLVEGKVEVRPIGGTAEISGTRRLLDADDPRKNLDERPGAFSLNVVTRPLVQDAILPTVAQVIGPGESDYLAQVEAVYDSFDVFAPVRYPRPQVTLIEPRVDRNLRKYRIAIEEALSVDAVDLIGLAQRRGPREGETQEIERLRGRQVEELRVLKEKLAGADPSIEGAFNKLVHAMDKGYATITERFLYQRQLDDEHLKRAITLVAESLCPTAQPQERRLNPIVPFAVHYGLDWPMRLMGNLIVDYREPMQLVYMNRL